MGLVIPVQGSAQPEIITRYDTVYQSIVVTDSQGNNDPVYGSIDVANVFHQSAYQSQDILATTSSIAAQTLEVSRTADYPVYQSQEVGETSRVSVARSVDVSGGDGVLVIADIVKAGIGEGSESENSIQIIDLDDPTGGTWTIWLNYMGYAAETVNLDFDATALEVQNALLDLSNVPSEDSIEVIGPVGGPYTVEFQNDMGHRFIFPLTISILSLTGDVEPSVEVEQPGSTVGSFTNYEVNAELRVNDSIVPISSFEYNEPSGKLGSILNVQLADPRPELIPIGASIEFALTVKTTAGTSRKVLMKNGKLSGRDYKMSFKSGAAGGPNDEVSFGAIDIIADRFTLAPRRPVIMFDPAKISFGDVQLRPVDAVLDEAGRPIMPVYEHINNLSMLKVLRRAYTDSGGYSMMSPLSPVIFSSLSQIQHLLSTPETDQVGMRFANVLTNIPDYRIKRADFSIDGGWHSGAQPVVGMYDPLYLPLGNILYVLNIEFPLPFGALPRIITMSQPTALTQTLPFKSDTNAVTLTYQISANSDPTTDMYIVVEFEEETQETEDGSSETYIRTRYLRKKMFADNSVVAEVVEEVMQETRTDFGTGRILSHRETTQNFYDDDLKVGHIKRVEGLILTGPTASPSLTTVLTETCQITWKEDPINLGQKIQTRNYTKVDGLVYTQVDTYTRLNPVTGEEETVPYMFPAISAQESGIIANDDGVEGTTLSNMTIETTEETLRHVQGNQFDVSVVITNWLTKTVKRSTTSPRTGDTSSNPYASRSKTMLLRDEESELEIGPRIPIPVNAGELPRERAIALGELVLYRAKNPLNSTTLPLANVDFGLERGTVIVGQTRYSYTKRHIITGLSIKGVNLGRTGHRINMSVEATELPTTT